MKNKTKSKQKPRKEIVQNESSDGEENEMQVVSEEQQVEEDDQSIADPEEVEAGASDLEETSEKKKKKGIIYLSSIPKFMNVTILREMLSEYAQIDRIFLQPGKLTSKLFTIFRNRTGNYDNFTNSVCVCFFFWL